MQDNAPPPNPDLAAHVQDHSFVLTLKKTHIGLIVAVAHGLDSDYWKNNGVIGRNDLITPATGLRSRGLLLHWHDVFGRHGHPIDFYPWRPKSFKRAPGEYRVPLHHYYRLTRAGWLVFDLLVEAGMANPVPKRGRVYAEPSPLAENHTLTQAVR